MLLGRRVGRLSVDEKVPNDLNGSQGGIGRNGALVGNQTSNNSRNTSKPGGHVATDVVDGHVLEEELFDPDGGELHARVDCSSNRTAKRVPNHVIEPGEELSPTMLPQILYK